MDEEEWYWDPYFTPDEMRCKETGELDMDETFMDLLWAVRDLYNKPITVTSAYRSPDHSVERVKDSPGEHTLGKAADIWVPAEDMFEVIHYARLVGFTRLGVGDDFGFIHLGTATEEDGFPQTVWTY
jgi:uncharacterized protein YcbK (DUF882 family)